MVRYYGYYSNTPRVIPHNCAQNQHLRPVFHYCSCLNGINPWYTSCLFGTPLYVVSNNLLTHQRSWFILSSRKSKVLSFVLFLQLIQTDRSDVLGSIRRTLATTSKAKDMDKELFDVKIDKRFFSVVSLSDQSDDKDYWFSRNPIERLRFPATPWQDAVARQTSIEHPKSSILPSMT